MVFTNDRVIIIEENNETPESTFGADANLVPITIEMEWSNPHDQDMEEIQATGADVATNPTATKCVRSTR